MQPVRFAHLRLSTTGQLPYRDMLIAQELQMARIAAEVAHSADRFRRMCLLPLPQEQPQAGSVEAIAEQIATLRDSNRTCTRTCVY